MRAISAIIILTALLGACSRSVKTEVLELPSIRPSSIYDFDSVYLFRQHSWEQNTKIASSYFSQGEKIEGENLPKAIWHYKRAITLNPLPEYYDALGKALIKNKAYGEAARMYHLLTAHRYVKDGHGERYEFVFGKTPSEKDYYNRMLSYMLAYDYLQGYELSQARENGIDITGIRDKLLADERIKYDTASVAYKNFLNLFLSEEEIAAYTSKPENFRVFLNRFPDTGSTYHITTQSVADFKYDRTGENDGLDELSLSVLEMNFLKQKQEFPDAWFEYNTRHAGWLSDSVCYVIYAIDTSGIACPRAMRHVSYTLATYTANGKIIDTKSIAWQAGEHLAEAVVVNNEVTVKTYTRKWKLPYQKNSYDNELLRTEPAATINMKIEPDGSIRVLNPQS